MFYANKYSITKTKFSQPSCGKRSNYKCNIHFHLVVQYRVNWLQYLKLALAVTEIKMYRQSVTIPCGPLRNRQPVACFAEARSDCP